MNESNWLRAACAAAWVSALCLSLLAPWAFGRGMTSESALALCLSFALAAMGIAALALAVYSGSKGKWLIRHYVNNRGGALRVKGNRRWRTIVKPVPVRQKELGTLLIYLGGLGLVACFTLTLLLHPAWSVLLFAASAGMGQAGVLLNPELRVKNMSLRALIREREDIKRAKRLCRLEKQPSRAFRALRHRALSRLQPGWGYWGMWAAIIFVASPGSMLLISPSMFGALLTLVGIASALLAFAYYRKKERPSFLIPLHVDEKGRVLWREPENRRFRLRLKQLEAAGIDPQAMAAPALFFWTASPILCMTAAALMLGYRVIPALILFAIAALLFQLAAMLSPELCTNVIVHEPPAPAPPRP